MIAYGWIGSIARMCEDHLGDNMLLSEVDLKHIKAMGHQIIISLSKQLHLLYVDKQITH